jgi:hypothetical protein
MPTRALLLYQHDDCILSSAHTAAIRHPPLDTTTTSIDAKQIAQPCQQMKMLASRLDKPSITFLTVRAMVCEDNKRKSTDKATPCHYPDHTSSVIHRLFVSKFQALIDTIIRCKYQSGWQKSLKTTARQLSVFSLRHQRMVDMFHDRYCSQKHWVSIAPSELV